MTKTTHTSKIIGLYLLDRLHDHGIEHIFGVPGDYVLKFDKLIEDHQIKLINTTRENTAGFMADAYARVRGLGCACITYGVGINIVNAVSQAFVLNTQASARQRLTDGSGAVWEACVPPSVPLPHAARERRARHSWP